MIKTSNILVRETTAEWTYFEDGEVKTEKIRVQYKGRSTREFKEAIIAAKAAAEKEKVEKEKTGKDQPETVQQTATQTDVENLNWYSDQLLKRLHGLPDIGDDNGKPIEISLEWLDLQDAKNLKKIVEAIEEHENPKPQTTT